jgi:malate dehydrogenase (oxaloacetate-decarboxylating)
MQRAGLEGDALTRAIALIDSGGMLVDSREIADAFKLAFAWPAKLAQAAGLDTAAKIELLDAVATLRPTIMIGTSGQAGAFSEDVIRAVVKGCSEPAIFPFSNPTSKAEAVPADIIHWTDGRALVATGSPFPEVDYGGRSIRIGQSNNVYVFPGVGLGCLVGEVREVTDSMFTIAAEIVAASVSDEALASGTLFPRLTELREITARIACAVVREANRLAIGGDIPDAEIEARVSNTMWNPEYPKIEAV